MRNPKYRIWNKKRKKWHHYGISLLGEVIILGEILNAMDDEPVDLIDMNDLVVNEYTGLKIGSEEIYEGDILEGDENGNWEVYWVDAGFEIRRKFLNESINICRCGFVWKKIGNIYENPELSNCGEKVDE